ncbi:MAG: response regulator [Lachnospiraceae bacterium]|nr:response regulator [Lachnospiraceae bacterium]
MNSENIMVIDDDISLLHVLENILTKAGYTANLANSGREALSKIEKGFIPDIILLDLAMPDMNGFETFSAIRSITNTPIIFITAIKNNETELSCLELGAVDYITKPFINDILLARIRIHLNNQTHTYEKKAKVAATYDTAKLTSMDALLTDTEFNVGKLIAMGYSNQEIADQLNFSYGYVKKIAYRIFDKLNISKRTDVREYFMK